MDGRSPRRVFIASVGLVVIGGLFSLLSTGKSVFPRYMPAIAGIVTCVAAVATKLPGLLLPGALFLGAGVELLVAREMPQTEGSADYRNVSALRRYQPVSHSTCNESIWMGFRVVAVRFGGNVGAAWSIHVAS